MYSMTVFTTIGYGNLTPSTDLGKLVTMVYALVGIPLMFIYMANIGTVLASSFKFLYSKLCRCSVRPADLPDMATLPSICREDNVSLCEQTGSEQRVRTPALLQVNAGCPRKWLIIFLDTLHYLHLSPELVVCGGGGAPQPVSPPPPGQAEEVLQFRDTVQLCS